MSLCSIESCGDGWIYTGSSASWQRGWQRGRGGGADYGTPGMGFIVSFPTTHSPKNLNISVFGCYLLFFTMERY